MGSDIARRCESLNCGLGIGAAHGWRLLIFVVWEKRCPLFTCLAEHGRGTLVADVLERGEVKGVGAARYAGWNRMDCLSYLSLFHSLTSSSPPSLRSLGQSG